MTNERTFPLRWDLTGEDALVEGAVWRRYIALDYLDPSDGLTKVWDTTGYTAAMTVRDAYDGTVLLSATTENGRLTVGDADYTLIIELSGAATGDTDLAPLKDALGVWDVWVTDAGARSTMLYTGRVALEPRVTP